MALMGFAFNEAYQIASGSITFYQYILHYLLKDIICVEYNKSRYSGNYHSCSFVEFGFKIISQVMSTFIQIAGCGNTAFLWTMFLIGLVNTGKNNYGILANKSWKYTSLKQNEFGWNEKLYNSGYPGCHPCLSAVIPPLCALLPVGFLGSHYDPHSH